MNLLLAVKRLVNYQFKAVKTIFLNPISSSLKHLSKYLKKILCQNCSQKIILSKNLSFKEYISQRLFKKLPSQLKKLLIFQERICKAWKLKSFCIFFYIFFLIANFSNISAKEKSCLYFFLLVAKLSKFKYFLIIKHFSHSVILFSLFNKLSVFIFWEIFLTFRTILQLFFLLFRKILISFMSFFSSFSLFSW